MTAPLKQRRNLKSCEGYSVVDLLIVVVIILTLASYVWTQLIQAQRTQVRSNAAQQLAYYLETARSDSMRRRATEAAQMAQVTLLNETFYAVTLDANGDGMLDAPVVVSLAGQDLAMAGPFPRTFMFNSSGKPVDSSQKSIGAAQIVFANRGGKSAVTVSDMGKATFVQPGTLTISPK